MTAETITMAGVDRIMRALQPWIDQSVLEQTNRDVLFQELQLCAVNFLGRKSRTTLRLTNQKLKDFGRFKRLLLKLRDDPKTPWRLLGEETTNALRSDKIVGELDSVLQYGPEKRLRANPTELLVGQDLPFIFYKFTGRRASRSRMPDTALRNGPYLAFAQAVLAEMKINYSNHSISRALTDWGQKRQRHKKRAVRRVLSKTA
jgi:hypothetical protein